MVEKRSIKATKNRKVILLDTVRKQDTHHLNKHKLTLIGDLTPANFNRAVSRAFADSSTRGGANIVYQAELLPSGRPKLIARLYQAKRNKAGKKTFKMFAAFHHPDGTRLRARAKTSRLFDKSEKVYPSRPPIPPGMNTLLRKLVKV